VVTPWSEGIQFVESTGCSDRCYGDCVRTRESDHSNAATDAKHQKSLLEGLCHGAIPIEHYIRRIVDSVATLDRI
jgi:hypothetical protein